MNLKRYCYFLAFATLLASCDPESKKLIPILEQTANTTDTSGQHFLITSSGDSILTGVPIPAKGRWINPDSVAKPRTIPLRGKPKVVPAHANIHPVGTPKVIQIPEKLTVITPGKDGVPLPKTVPAQSKVVPTIQPKPMRALPPRIKDAAINNIQYMDVDQGLNSSYVRSMLEDSQGNLWFGTEAGVSWYDGCSFIHYTIQQGLNHNWVFSILEDSRGNLWFGTYGGVSRYNGSSFTQYTTDEGLSDNRVVSMTEDSQGNLWFGTYNGVSRYNGSSFTQYTTDEGLSDNRVESILEDSQGNLWFGTYNGVSRYNGSSFTQYTTDEGLSDNRVESILEDSQGNLWFGTYNGVSRYNGSSFTQYTTDEGLSDNWVVSMTEDSQGSLWFGTYGDGVNRYNGSSFTQYTTDEGLSNNWVESILEDSQGNLWFGTYGGVSRYDVNSFIHYTIKEGLGHNWVLSMLEDSQRNLWFGTRNGLSLYNEDTFTYFTTKENLGHNEVESMLEDSQGNLWFGTRGGGVSRYDGSSFIHYTTKEGLSSNWVESILEDSQGNLWFGTYNGVSRYDGSSFTHYTTKEGLSNNRVRFMLEDSLGNLWFGTNGGGVCRYDGNNFTYYTTIEGLSDNRVLSMLEDSQGNLWLGTYGNVCRYNGRHFTQYFTNKGLTINWVWSMLEDNNKNIWMGTQKGIALLVPPPADSTLASESGVGDYQIVTFDKIDGLKRLDFELNSICIDRNNRIWWGSAGGLTTLDLNKFEIPTIAPQIKLNTIEVAQAFVDYRRLRDTAYSNNFPFGNNLSNSFDSVVPFYNYPATMSLPFDLNHLTFQFSAIDWTAPQKIQYSYQMEGLDKNWSPLSAEPKADYRNIPYGTYTFKVKATGFSQIESEPFEYKFTVLPPWYHTWWARLLYLTLGLVGIFGYVRWRTFALRKRQKELEHTVEERTIEVRERNEEILEKNVQLEDTLNNLKTTQQQLIQQEKMASLGQMTAGIAHEIKNPLNFVNNFAEGSVEMSDELKEELERYKNSNDPEDYQLLLDLLEDIRENAVLIHDNGQRADNIVSSMMDHANENQGERRPTDLNALLEEYINLAHHGYQSKKEKFKVEFQKQLDPDLPKILINPQEIGRVLINLFNNAIYAVDQKAEIETQDYKPTILVSTQQVNEEVEIRIRDNGPGIPTAVKDKIFNPFFTTKPTGQGNTGLGLSISYDIVVQGHQGKLICESEEGEFTEFIILLPLSDI